MKAVMLSTLAAMIVALGCAVGDIGSAAKNTLSWSILPVLCTGYVTNAPSDAMVLQVDRAGRPRVKGTLVASNELAVIADRRKKKGRLVAGFGAPKESRFGGVKGVLSILAARTDWMLYLGAQDRNGTRVFVRCWVVRDVDQGNDRLLTIAEGSAPSVERWLDQNGKDEVFIKFADGVEWQDCVQALNVANSRGRLFNVLVP
jgi:hypothetical protein